MLTAPDRSHRRETRVANSSQKLRTIQRGTRRNGRRRAERGVLASSSADPSGRAKKNIRRRCVRANLDGRETREVVGHARGFCLSISENLCLYLAFISGIRLATRRHLSLRFSPLPSAPPPPPSSPAHETFTRRWLGDPRHPTRVNLNEYPSYNFQLFDVPVGGTEIFGEIVVVEIDLE